MVSLRLFRLGPSVRSRSFLLTEVPWVPAGPSVWQPPQRWAKSTAMRRQRATSGRQYYGMLRALPAATLIALALFAAGCTRQDVKQVSNQDLQLKMTEYKVSPLT